MEHLVRCSVVDFLLSLATKQGQVMQIVQPVDSLLIKLFYSSKRSGLGDTQNTHGPSCARTKAWALSGFTLPVSEPYLIHKDKNTLSPPCSDELNTMPELQLQARCIVHGPEFNRWTFYINETCIVPFWEFYFLFAHESSYCFDYPSWEDRF